MLASAQLELRDYDGARETAQKIARLSVDGALSGLILAQIDANSGHLHEAIARLRTIYSAYPSDMRVILQLVQALLAVHDHVSALAVVNDVLKRHVDDASAYLLASECYLDAGDVPNAVKSLQQSIQAKPNSPVAYRHLGDLYFQTGQNALAMTVITDGLHQAPDDYDLLLLRAELDATSNLDQAIEEYQGLLTKFPNNLILVNNLVCALDQKGDAASINKAVKIARALQGSSNPFFEDTFGWASFLAGNTVDAMQNLRAATNAMPGNKEFQAHWRAASQGDKPSAAAQTAK